MICYIFTSRELMLLCGIMQVQGLAKHQFPETHLSDDEFASAAKTLAEKGFIAVADGRMIINSGIAFLIRSMGNTKRLLIGDGERKFTGYITDKLSMLLICDKNSPNLLLHPYETEDELIEKLHENEIYEWKDIRMEEEP
jgi:hypothetical protein